MTIVPQTRLARLGWVIADGWTITRRYLLHWRRQPGAVAAGLLFPVLIVLMFGYLFGGAMSVPGGGSYREFLMPGMFAMTMVFGIAMTMIAVTTDVSKGVMDRFRSMPMAPSAVLVGRSAADMLYAGASLFIMVVCGLAIGWRPHGSMADTALALGLLLLLRFAFIWVGIYLGLVAKNPEAVTAAQTLEFPLGFLSNAFAATATMPFWLGTIADWNPLSSTIAATRELFGNPGAGGDSWIAQHALLMAIVWPLLIVAMFFPLAVRSFCRLSH